MKKKRFLPILSITLLISSLLFCYFNKTSTQAVTTFGHLGGTDYSSSSVTRATVIGDINNDGYQDFAVADPFYNSDSGQVFIHLGGRSITSADYTLSAQENANNFGISIMRLGKFNNDAYDDFAVFETNANAIYCYVYYGGNPFNTTTEITISQIAASLGTYYNYLPESIAPDIDDDGYSDIILPYFNGSTSRADIFKGGENPDATADDNIPAPALYVGGIATSAFDFNGDDADDVAIFWLKISDYSTYLKLYFGGSPLDKTADIDLPVPTITNLDDFYLENFLNDINGDNKSEFAFYDSANDRYSIYFGGSSISSSPDATISLGNTDDYVGISSAGDLNGDTYNDFFYHIATRQQQTILSSDYISAQAVCPAH